jgi:hypothetical protein
MTTTTETPIDITPAIDLLHARSYEGGLRYAYEAKEVSEVYLVTRERMEDLTTALARDEDGNAYSLWCSEPITDDEHCSLEDVRSNAIDDDPDLDAYRTEAISAGDTLTVAAIDLLA